MKEIEGWFFDIYIQDDLAVLWIKSDDELLRIIDYYKPFFYIKPEEGYEDQIIYKLQDCSIVSSISIEYKRTSLSNNKRERLVRVETNGTHGFKELVRTLNSSPLVKKLFNTDLKHVQRYLFSQLRIEPTSKVILACSKDRLVFMHKQDDSRDINPPPFNMMRFKLDYETNEKGRFIKSIKVSFNGKEKNLIGKEEEVLTSFSDYVHQANPDLLSCPDCDEFTFPLLMERATANFLDIGLGRSSDRQLVISQGSIGGRIMLGDIFYGYDADDWGIAGLVERTRFAFAPIGLATRWKSNKSINSRNSFELIERGYAIPKEDYFEYARDIREIIQIDRGGIMFTPEVGLHENVGLLDFESRFPNIMIKNKLSYERITENGMFSLIPTVIEPFTRRRMWLKQIRNNYQKGSDMWRYCEQRIETLKLITVTQYCIAGCCWNRFGNVLTFEAINKESRKALIKAKSIAENKGFRIIYGDIDSLFLSKLDATKGDYEQLAKEISVNTGLPMSFDKYFRFIAFLRTKEDYLSSALRRYYGLTYDGEVEARGIELRRDDTPKFIRDFQAALIGCILDCKNIEEVYSLGVRRGQKFFQEVYSSIKSCKLDPRRLIIRKSFRKNLCEFKNKTLHYSAALQSLALGKYVKVGYDSYFFLSGTNNVNPLCRVKLIDYAKELDINEYARMLVESANAIFGALTRPKSIHSYQNR